MEKQYYKIVTYGCQMNENDSEKLAGMIEKLGYTQQEDETLCDLLVINTCSVRENANERFFGHLGVYKHIKETINQNLIIVVCGCMMQQEEIVQKILGKFSFVDIIFGTHNLSDFPGLLTRRLKGEKKIYCIKQADLPEDDCLQTKRAFRHKALIKIMSGCDNFCSYCIVPYTRGRERSRKSDEILDEIRRLRDDEVKEIMLLGQNVNSYGKGLHESVDFPELLRKCAAIEGIERIRFMTSHPKDLSDDLIEVIAEHENVCPHVHLPVQSGSNRVLCDMNRRYTREQYLLIVDKMRRNIQDFSLSTDIIVGFPTETNEDFQETLDLVRECRFDNIFTFLYSRREHTKAKDMPSVLTMEAIKENFNELLYVQKRIQEENMRNYHGKVMEIFVENVDEMKGMASGRSMNNILIHFQGKAAIGEKAALKITQTKGFYLIGQRLQKNARRNK